MAAEQWGMSEEERARLRARYEEKGEERVAPGAAPPPRTRWEYGEAGKGPTFFRYQSTEGYITLGDTDTIVIHFEGVPAEIEIFVLDFPAIVGFLDELQEPVDDIRIEANIFYNPQIRAHKIRARNATAGSNARIQVVGKWAEELAQEERYGR